jgi:hypothetical protein
MNDDDVERVQQNVLVRNESSFCTNRSFGSVGHGRNGRNRSVCKHRIAFYVSPYLNMRATILRTSLPFFQFRTSDLDGIFDSNSIFFVFSAFFK